MPSPRNAVVLQEEVSKGRRTRPPRSGERRQLVPREIKRFQPRHQPEHPRHRSIQSVAREIHFFEGSHVDKLLRSGDVPHKPVVGERETGHVFVGGITVARHAVPATDSDRGISPPGGYGPSLPVRGVVEGFEPRELDVSVRGCCCCCVKKQLRRICEYDDRPPPTLPM